MKLTTYLHLVLRLRMHGAIPPHTQYIFMAYCLVKHRNYFFVGVLLWTSPIMRMKHRKSFMGLSKLV